jgi:lipoate-protein ligase A
LEWKLPEKDYSLMIEVDLYMYKNGKYIGRKDLGKVGISITDTPDDFYVFLESIYQSLPDEQRIELTDSYNEMMATMKEKTKYKRNEWLLFNNGLFENFFSIIIY